MAARGPGYFSGAQQRSSLGEMTGLDGIRRNTVSLRPDTPSVHRGTERPSKPCPSSRSVPSRSAQEVRRDDCLHAEAAARCGSHGDCSARRVERRKRLLGGEGDGAEQAPRRRGEVAAASDRPGAIRQSRLLGSSKHWLLLRRERALTSDCSGPGRPATRAVAQLARLKAADGRRRETCSARRAILPLRRDGESSGDRAVRVPRLLWTDGEVGLRSLVRGAASFANRHPGQRAADPTTVPRALGSPARFGTCPSTERSRRSPALKARRDRPPRGVLMPAGVD